MSYSLEEKVKQFAIISRLGIIFLQFLANIWIPDHDAGVFQKPLQTRAKSDDFLEVALGGLTRWDGQYYLHIAHYGYTYENTLAFFPLFPLIIRQFSFLIYFFIDEFFEPVLLGNLISLHSILIIVAVLFNFFIFIKTSTIFFKLSMIVLKNEKLAFISAILFCINPASIFFSAVYSESLYCFLVFYGLLQIEKNNLIVSYLIIGLTGAVRSNGLINIGFIIYKYIKIKVSSKLSFFHNIIFNFGLILSVSPFLAYQIYCYSKFCLIKKFFVPKFIKEHGNSNNFIFPGVNTSSWCNNLIPFAYAYVQKHYWNVGFLNYYVVKQLPNFILAFPIIYIMARGSYDFIKHYKYKLLYLGLLEEKPGKELPISIFPYFLHGIALTLFSLFMVHIQVTTRLLASSSPIPYWYCASVLASSIKNSVESDVLNKLKRSGEESFHEAWKNRKSRWRTFLLNENFTGYSFFIKWYFLTYYFVGTTMFSNYLPWT